MDCFACRKAHSRYYIGRGIRRYEMKDVIDLFVGKLQHEAGHLYFVATALRGPDFSPVWVEGEAYSPAYHLKEITTGVVRYFAGIKSPALPTKNPQQAQDYWTKLPSELQNRARELWQTYPHFGWHIKSALASLDCLGCSAAHTYWCWLSSKLEGGMT